MRVLGISGSPRKNGNSERMLDYCARFFNDQGIDFETFLVSETAIGPCVHCDFCKKNDYCSKDEKANELNTLLSGCDAVIMVTPVYFGSMSGQMKCIIDKTLPLRRNGFQLKGKPGAAIAVGGSRNGGQELAIRDVHAWMFIHGMLVVGDNSHFGGTVYAPFEDDDIGRETVNGTLTALADIIKRLASGVDN
ncbi:MAG TPA: flavodoxin family protein [Spirochaetota bacterium]|nr:flavodoxin family protein [Spirochaetota bacterium]HPI88179.1 flavodoxin family protein [Spirochaetota bacterium]HPR47954.1 flavodoxin family protein [Spirochaetota bacterium]